MLVALVTPLLALTGFGDPVAPGSDVPEVPQTPVTTNATVEADTGGVDLDVTPESTGVFVQTRLPGPSVTLATAPAEESEPLVGDPSSSSSQAEANPVALPSPKQTAVPAGLAVLGAAAYAAFRWRYLLGSILAPMYTRLSKSDLLDNETRNALHELIEDNPGLSTQELCDRVDAGWGNTVYHLQRLQQAGFVTSEKQGHHRRFYKNGEVESEEIEALGVLKNDNANKIARYLVQDPGANQTEVCEALDISPSLAHKWISRLEENDLVESEQEWRSKHYTPDDRLEHLVQCVE